MKKIINTIIICIAVTVMALVAGYTGSVILLTSQKINMPFIGKINLEEIIPHKNIIIEKKEHVSVNSDTQLQSVYKSTQNFMVYIAKKNVNGIYTSADMINKGFVFTTDGWIFSNNQSVFDKNSEYVVILNDGDVFDVTNIMFDKYDFVLLKIEKQKMLVAPLVSYNDVNVGSTVIVNDLNNGVKTDYVSNKNNGIINITGKQRSDICLFDLSGKIIGVYGADYEIGTENVKVYSTDYLKNIIFSINSKSEYIKRPNLNSVSFSKFEKVFGSLEKQQNRIIVNSVNKDKDYGFKDGDLIVSIDNVEVSADMEFMLQKYNVGDKVRFTLLRNGEEVVNTVVLE